jgi:hypothetical protein
LDDPNFHFRSRTLTRFGVAFSETVLWWHFCVWDRSFGSESAENDSSDDSEEHGLDNQEQDVQPVVIFVEVEVGEWVASCVAWGLDGAIVVETSRWLDGAFLDELSSSSGIELDEDTGLE